MATVTTSIGTKATTGDPVNGALTMISGGSGSGTPWTGTVKFSTSPTANVGDQLYFENVYHPGQFGSGCEGGGTADVIYLITGVSGDTLTVKYISGAYSTTSPYDIKSDSFCTTAAQPYVVRFYSTITTWDADLNESDLYSSGDTAKGECYADSALSQSGLEQLDGGMSVGLSTVILTVPVGQRHDGTADSGAKVNLTNGGRFALWYQSSGHPHRTIEWLELDGGDSTQAFGGNGTYVIGLSVGGQTGTASHLLMHGCHNSNTANVGGMINSLSARSAAFDNIIYDCSGVLQTVGIKGGSSSMICNNTVYKLGMTYGSVASSGARTAIGIQCPSNCVIKNNIAIGTYFAVADLGHEKYDYLVSGAGTVGTYNLSGDSTASGSDSITGVSTASLFISTTSGSEDLHILRSSSAVGAGEDLGTSVTSGSFTLGGSTYGSPINRDINNGDRNSRAMAWDIGASQNAIVSTIGTSSREYSTVAAWTADLDEDTYYGAGSVARGECYADTAFTACHLENGGTIGLVRVVLTAADGQQHDGAAGTGVVFNMADEVTRASSGAAVTMLSFLEFTQSSAYGNHDAVDAYTSPMQVSHCLIHGYDLRQANSDHTCLLRQPSGGGGSGNGMICHNNILYDLTRGIVGSQNCTLYGIKQFGAYAATTNNTVYNIHADSTDGSITQNAIGIYVDRTYHRYYNNISMGISSANGTATCMICEDSDSPSHASNNMVNDTSETGGSSQTGKSSSGQFVSTTTDSEDLHLVVGSDAIGNGADLGVEIDAGWGATTGMSYYAWGLNYDINGRDRHAESDDWDIGAHQFVASAATTNTAFMFFVD